MKARAMAARCCIPPESSRGYFCSKPANPTMCKRSRARSRAAFVGKPTISAGSITLSMMLRQFSRSACWNTMPTSRPGLKGVTALPIVKRAAVRLMQTRQHLEHRGLAAARRPDQRDEFSLRDIQSDVGDGKKILVAGAVNLADVLQGDERRSRLAHASHRWRFSATKASSARSECSRKHAVDLFGLARAQTLVRIETPNALQQPLAAQNFVAPGNAAVECVRHIEESSIAVGDPCIEREKVLIDLAGRLRRTTALEQSQRRFWSRPTNGRAIRRETRAAASCLLADVEGQGEIEHDVIVVAGIKRDTLRCVRGDNAFEDVERAITIERCDLDRNDIVDRRECRPEIRAKFTPADSGLQIKPDQRDFLGDRAAMLDDFAG